MNIEEFVNYYLQNYRHEVLLNPYNGLVEFAKVFQKKLMEDAVEAEVRYFGETQGVPRTITIPRMQEWLKPFKDGDKVRLIICKKED